MVSRLAVLFGLVVAIGATGSVSAADPPQPGTTDSGLNESEEATLWSNMPPEHFKTDGGDRTVVHDIATGSDLTFIEPPSTAHRWTRYAHKTYQPGEAETSVYPASASTDASRYIKDAHATVFAATPSTRTHIDATETRRYVAPDGELFGTVDYRIEIPSDDRRGGWSYSWRVRNHEIDEVRLYADSVEVAVTDGTHRPTFEYELANDVETLRIEADIHTTVEETADPPPGSNRSKRTRDRTDSITVSDTIDVTVYAIDPIARYVEYPNGRKEVSISQTDPWQGYTLDPDTEARVRGVWRFFTARDTRWDYIVTASETSTNRRESDVLPVSVHAYPATAGPRTKPEFDGPKLLRTWGDSYDSPADSLPEHVSVDVVDTTYNETYGVATSADTIDPETVTVHGLVYGTEANPRSVRSEPREIEASNLSAAIIDRSDDGIRVRLTLKVASTGEPISLSDERDSSVTPGGETGHISISDKQIKTNESGKAVVFLSNPGTHTAKYEPASWLDSSPAYAGDSATIHWDSLTTVSMWLDLVVRLGLVLVPFLVMLYAGKRLGRFLSGAY
jgi:hypothetical protein